MIQEIAPHIYNNVYCERAPRPDDFALWFAGNTVLLRDTDGALTLPRFSDLAPADACGADHLFEIDGHGFFLLDAAPASAGGALAMHAAAEFRTMQPQWMAFGGVTASQLYRWKTARRYCGRCGHPTEKSRTERAMVCPACGNTEYPKICPAVIVAVTDGERILLARNAHGTYKRLALIAGFVEFGETFEDTVRREVMEEVGLRVKNIRYYKSQPWAFTDTEMIGFTAQLDGQDALTVQESELSEAGWYRREEIPAADTTISIGQEMIERFRLGEL